MQTTPSKSQARIASFAISLERIFKAKYVPNFIKPLLKFIYFSLQDIRYYSLKGFNSMVPPPTYAYIGVGNYEAIGKEFFQYFINLANLKPDEQVLDIGCGSGRLSLPLTGYLSDQGGYSGFDIIKSEIDWAQKRITTKYPNFIFKHVDVNNNLYHQSELKAEDFKFPYKNESFDFIFLNSVFTHMQPEDIKNYIGEIERVLKPKGRCLITFFLLNEESSEQIKLEKSIIDFKYLSDDVLTNNEEIPEDAIALEEEEVIRYFNDKNMVVNEPIHYGSWCQRKNYLSFQDIIIASKKLS